MPAAPPPAPLHVAVRRLDAAALEVLGHTAASACAAVYARALVRGAPSFWLDSALPDEEARWSVLGDAVDVLGEGSGAPSPGPRIVSVPYPADPADLDPDAAWEALAEAAAPRPVDGGEELPLRGGMVGFLGYELGLADLGVTPPAAGPGDPVPTPALFWLRPSRYAVADRADGSLTCVVVGLEAERAEGAADTWAGRVREALAAEATSPSSGDGHAGDAGLIPGTWRDDAAAYAELVSRCHGALHAGDSYELCLTTRFDADPAARIDPLELFLDLAAHHPVPYAALLEHGPVDGAGDGAGGDDDAGDGEAWAVVSASPERFLSGRDGRYSTKPIKGTAPRDPDPARDRQTARAMAADAKTRAENLMIVDLLRNDLSRVCVPGSVQVPALMAVETYASVHQLVSTVTGVARAGVEPVDVVRSLFPGGSMTGAPKRRTVELLAGWEGAPRGVYAGALGLLGADGAVELSVVIRTAVLSGGGDDHRWSLGAGGAVVADSTAEAEHAEVLLKASALRAAMARVARG